MLRVFHPGLGLKVGDEIVLAAAESTHLVRVRRARVGEKIEMLDGSGGSAEGVLMLANPKVARVKTEKVMRHPAPWPRVLAVGLPKGDGFTDIIRQATELGVTELQPLITTRTEIHLEGTRAERKLERWRAAALEACKQSGNPWLPQIHAPVALPQWMKSLPQKSGERRLVAALTSDAVPLSQLETREAKLKTVLAVGPEGDFSPEEYETLRKSGFIPIRLPGFVLRVETACVAGLTLTRGS